MISRTHCLHSSVERLFMIKFSLKGILNSSSLTIQSTLYLVRPVNSLKNGAASTCILQAMTSPINLARESWSPNTDWRKSRYRKEIMWPPKSVTVLTKPRFRKDTSTSGIKDKILAIFYMFTPKIVMRCDILSLQRYCILHPNLFCKWNFYTLSPCTLLRPYPQRRLLDCTMRSCPASPILNAVVWPKTIDPNAWATCRADCTFNTYQ